MATSTERINELNKLIEAAKAENIQLDLSINGSNQAGGNWKESLQKNCGVTWETNKKSPPCSTTFKCTGVVDCPSIWDLITTRTNKIATNLIDIGKWQGEVNALLKDPNFQKDFEDAEARRKNLRLYAIVGAVIILAIAGVYIYRRYKK